MAQLRGDVIITAAPAVVGAALHKMQVAWLPNAQHMHPWLITGHAANSLFDFIDVLKICGSRRSSEAEIIQLCLFHPSPGDCLPSSILLLGLEGWGAFLCDRRTVVIFQIQRVLRQHSGTAVKVCLPGPKLH